MSQNASSKSEQVRATLEPCVAEDNDAGGHMNQETGSARPEPTRWLPKGYTIPDSA